MPIFNNALAGASGGAGGGGYVIERSLRFNSGDSSHLYRDFSDGNITTWTWSGWVKRSKLGSSQFIFQGGNTDFNDDGLLFNANDKLQITFHNGTNAVNGQLVTTQVFRDLSAWYSIVLVADTSNSNGNDRMRLYVNGSRVTAFDTNNNPTQNTGSHDINRASRHHIGTFRGGHNFLDAYLANIQFVDGQALDYTAFTEFDDNGVLQPKKFAGSYTLAASGSGIVYSNDVSGSVAGSPYDATKMFDGNLSTYTDHGSANSTITWTRTLTSVTSLRVYIHGGNSTNTVTTVGGSGTQTDTISTNFGPGWHTISLSTTGSTINSIAFTRGGGGNPLSVYAIEVNGTVLVDGTPAQGANSFHLDFKDNSSSASLGNDAAGSNNWTVNNLSVGGSFTSLASSTGALPILNTTDTYGRTLGSGVRSDSSASSLQICIPGGTSGGLNLSDQNPSGRTSALRNMTGSSLVNDTSTSTFYGGSLSVPHGVTGTYSNDVWTSIGSGAFTVEMWVYLVDSSMSDGYGYNVFCGRNAYDGIVNVGTTWTGHTGNVAALRFNCRPSSGSYTDHWVTDNGAKGAFPVGEWVHCAQTRDSSGTVRTFKNGVKVAESTGITGSLSINYAEFGGWSTSYSDPTEFKVCDIRVYTSAKYTSNFTPPKTTATDAEAIGNDSLVDSPSQIADQTDSGSGGTVVGNYAVMNPLLSPANTLSDGSLKVTAAGNNRVSLSTFGIPPTGKWYYEFTDVDSSSGAFIFGVGAEGVGVSDFLGRDINGWGYQTHASNASYYHNNNWSNTNSVNGFGNNTVVSVAIDRDANKIWFAVNGTFANSGNPATGANAQFSNLPSSGFLFAGASSATGKSFIFNGGQRAFAYSAPSGYKSLNTASLPTPTIADGSKYFDTLLWTGDGSTTRAITGLEFSPDLCWTKARSIGFGHRLWDTVRGATKRLESHATTAEATESSGVKSFDSSGFTIGNDGNVNQSGYTFASWNWDAGTSTVTNNDGSITSQVRAQPSAGFSIVTWTGQSSGAATVGTGLNAAPEMIIVKARTGSVGWTVGHQSLGWTKRLKLNGTDAESTSANYWNNTEPTSSVFTSGANNVNNTFVAYCFAPVAGYSAMGSYQGNGNTSGPFIHTGFRPAVIILKRTDSASSWQIRDTTRSPHNVVTENLYPNLSNAESTDSSLNLDILSNGFKPRTSTDGGSNASGGTYIYYAVAENPFKTTRAR